MPHLHSYLIPLFVIFIEICILVQMRLMLQNMEISANLTGLKVCIDPNLFAETRERHIILPYI